MFIEIGIVGSGYFIGKKTIEYLKDKDLREIKEIFNTTLCKAGIHNSTKEKGTFEIYNIKRMKYGYFTLIKLNGMTFDKLESCKDTIQDNMKCLVEFKKDRFSNLAQAKFIFSPQNDKDFKVVKTKSHELFLGYKMDGTPCILSLNTDPHILIAGKTNAGKSFFLASMLTNLIYYHKKYIELVLFQVRKSDIDFLKNCPSVKFSSKNPEEISIMLEKIDNKINERSDKFAEYGIKNIKQWNKHFPNQKIKRIIVVAEEVSFFTDIKFKKNNNNEENKDKKDNNEYFKYFTGLVKAGRSVGIHFICVTQRTTAKNLGGDGELKSQMCVITSRQRSEDDSKNAIDIKDAAHVELQEFICSGNEGYEMFRVPNIDEDYEILQQYVPEIITPKKVIEQKKKEAKQANQKSYLTKANNILICKKSEWFTLDEYNKQKQTEIFKTIKSNPIPSKKTKRKNIIPLKQKQDA